MLAILLAALAPDAGTPPPPAWPWIDLVGAGIAGLFLLLGALRGLWWQVVRLLGIVAAVAVARAFAPRVSPLLERLMPGLSPPLVNGLAWLLLLVAGLIVVSMVARLGRKTLEEAQLGALDRVGGAAAGFVSGILVHVALLLCLCQLASTTWAASTVRGSRSQALLDVVGRSFPMLLDAHAAESLKQMHEEPGEKR